VSEGREIIRTLKEKANRVNQEVEDLQQDTELKNLKLMQEVRAGNKDQEFTD
jgi:hypothetical protein